MTKRLSVVLAATAIAAVGFAAVSNAAGPATTTVTIKQNSGDFFGYVKSSKPKRCADGRKVIVHKQKGQKQRPKSDPQVATDTASLNGNRAEWNIGNSGFSGRHYARVKKIKGCTGDRSRTIVAPS